MVELPSRFFYTRRLSRAETYLASLLEKNGRPVLTQFDFFEIIRRMYRESPGKRLYLRNDAPRQGDYTRFRSNLKRAGLIGADRDYGERIIQVLRLPDLPAEGIINLVDPTCYISHLSAMQRWGLTDRIPNAVMLTGPDRETASARLKARMINILGEEESTPFPLTIIKHPAHVRHRAVRLFRSKAAGACLEDRNDGVSLATIGQTFLDMLQKPDLCGGMVHVLDVWEEHASIYLDEIVAAVNTTTCGLVKSRAGYILEERLRLRHQGINRWKEYGQRGGSRRLDPDKAFAPMFSETWMISLNV